MNENREGLSDDDDECTDATGQYPALDLNSPEAATRNDPDDSPTDEYPMLSEAYEPPEDVSAALASAETATEPRPAGVAHALRRPEDDVQRLRETRSDDELREHETRILELEREVEARDAVVARLTQAREAAEAASRELATQLAEAEARADELVARFNHEAAELAKVRDEQVSAQKKNASLQSALERARADAGRSGAVAAEQRRSATELAERNEALKTQLSRLRDEMQYLKHYIDSRRKSWDELEAKLADQQETIADLERVIRSKEEQAAARDAENERLSARIRELERELAAKNDELLRRVGELAFNYERR